MSLRRNPIRTTSRLIAVATFALSWLPTAAIGQFAQTIAYQGYLTDNEGAPLNGNFELGFRLFDAEAGGTQLWSETQFEVPVKEGVFSVQLGSVEPLSGVAIDEPLFLEVVFGEGGLVLSPRLPLTAVPYSLRAKSLDEAAITAGDNITVEREGEAIRISATAEEADVPSALSAPDGNPGEAVVVDDDGNVGVGVAANTILAPLHIRHANIGLPAAAIENPGVVVEASDATVGIYSSEAGTFGSALELAEINEDGLVLVDKWSLVRETSTGNGLSRLRFTYGSNPNYALNSSLMTLLPQGFVGVGTDNPEGFLHVSDGGDAELILEADTGNRTGFEDRNPSITLRQDGNRANAFIAMEGLAGTRASGTLDNALVIGSEDNDPALQFVTDDEVRMTIGTDGSITRPARSKTHLVTGAELLPDRPYGGFFRGTPTLRLANTGKQTWRTRIHLPDGAVVTRATSHWRQTSFGNDTEDMTIRLIRIPQSGISSEQVTMAVLDGHDSEEGQSTTDSSIQAPVIDNRNIYQLRVDFPVCPNAPVFNACDFVIIKIEIDYNTTAL